LEREGLVLSPEDRRALYEVLTVKAGEVGGWRRTARKLVRAGDVPITLDMTKIVRSTHSALRTVLRAPKPKQMRRRPVNAPYA
jgi:hypothetical protein